MYGSLAINLDFMLGPIEFTKGCMCPDPPSGNQYIEAPWTPVTHRAEQGRYMNRRTLQWDTQCPAYQKRKAYASQQECHREGCSGLLPQTEVLACGLGHSLGLELIDRNPFMYLGT